LGMVGAYMKQSLIELVDVILQKMEDDPETQLTENVIRTWLQGKGYAKRDIDAALRLVRPRMEAPASPLTSPELTVRALSQYEELKLKPEAHKALVRLELFGLIEPMEREMVLERVSQYEFEVGVEELDYILSWVVGFGRDVETQQTIYNVLDGGDYTVH
jgi:uncharacterized protein Smg (DUF494 family)